MELRLLVAASVQLQCQIKAADFKQAFCQSYLPKGENYVLHPPKNYPHTLLNTYLKLIQTLYGLECSPRHWYEKTKATFLAMGLKQCANAPCVFTDKILPNQPPIYIGLYVDDFIYFSQSDEVDTVFEHHLKHDMQMLVEFK
eukprot:11744661-Ditylum_brightwellii.AAC.1